MTALFKFLGLLPLPLLHALGVLLGCVTYLSPSYRRRLRDNAALAGYSSAALCFKSALHAGKMACELPFLWLTRGALPVKVEGWDAVETALASGKGIVFLTPHLGCFEVTPRPFAERAAITVLYRPPKQGWLRELVESNRSRPNLHTAPANLAGVKQMLRALKRGETVGLLPDQVPQAGEGILVPFFGKPAWTMTLPARLVHATGATLLLAVGIRLPGGAGYSVRYSAFEGELSTDATEAAAQIGGAMESLIRTCPEQYLWGYNRYKMPRGEAV
jgi:Kdo2-lipid IVA lauroyltransferase/acyltransferase